MYDLFFFLFFKLPIFIKSLRAKILKTVGAVVCRLHLCSSLSLGLFIQCTEIEVNCIKADFAPTVNDGICNYHPISFVAKGLNVNYLLQPLYSLRDENYTVYFKIHS
uniref:Secreted protein n=1 Tax=Helianthus annuus TaxID=4232 RepID=A0A251SU39_HELAN